MNTVYEFLSRLVLKMGLTIRKCFLERYTDCPFRCDVSRELDAVDALEGLLKSTFPERRKG